MDSWVHCVTHGPHHSFCATPTLRPHLSPSCPIGFSCSSVEHTATLTFLFYTTFIFHQWKNLEIIPDSPYQQHPSSCNLYPVKRVQLLPHSSDVENKTLVWCKVPRVPEAVSMGRSPACCSGQNRACYCFPRTQDNMNEGFQGFSGWRTGSAIKSVSCKGPRFSSQHQYNTWQHLQIHFQWINPSSCLHRLCMHMIHIHTRR